MLFLLAWSLLLLLPVQWALPIGFIDESVPVARLLALVLMAGWFVQVLTNRTKEQFSPALVLGVLSWIPLLAVGMLIQDQLVESGWRKFIYVAGLWPLVLVWPTLFREKEQAIKLVWALSIGGGVSALLGSMFFVAQFVVGVERVFTWLTATILPFFLGERLATMVALYPSLLVNIGGATWLRLTSVFPDPHVAAFFFGMTAWLSVGAWLSTRQRFFLVAAIILFLADLLTFSRGGSLGLVMSALVFFLVVPLLRVTTQLKTVLVFGVGPLLVLFGWPIIERFWSSFTLADTSALSRLELWQTAITTFLAHPWFGVGLGQYAELMYPFQSEGVPYYAHNLFLDLVVEGGIIGALPFFLLLAASLRQAYRRARSGDMLSLGALVALTAYLTHSLFETALFSVPVMVLLTFVLALPFRPQWPSPVK